LSNPFVILELIPGASREEVEVAWRRKVQECPPEKDAAAFERVRGAYSRLSDPVSYARALVDAVVPRADGHGDLPLTGEFVVFPRAVRAR
jgi:curved DNA-binding protein CbpA